MDRLRMYAELSSAAIGLAAVVVLATLFGQWLDLYFGDTGVVTIVMVLVGALGGIVNLIKTVERVTIKKNNVLDNGESENPDA